MSSLGALLGDLFIAFTVLIITFLTGVEMFMARIEFWTVSLITVVLLPFAMHERTSFLAEKAIGAVFSLGVKVAVIAFLTAVTCPLLANFSKQISDQAAANEDLLELSALLQLTLACLVVFIMVRRIPQLAQGLISGSPSLTSGDFYDTMPNPVRGTARALAFAGSAYGTYKMATNMEGGGTARKADGDTSWLSQTTGTIRNIAAIEWNRHNPFLAEEREAEQGVRYMYSMRANSRDIDDTAHGRNDSYDEQGNLSHDHLYAATNQRNGARNKDGSVAKDGRGTNLTHGWTPAPKTDEQMDRNSAEKINAIYDSFNRKFNNKRK
jgi:type IV secretion system protein TrbL